MAPAIRELVKVIRVSMERTNLAGEQVAGDSAVLRDASEFANYFKRRYGLNKGETKAFELVYPMLVGWELKTIDWPQAGQLETKDKSNA